MTPAQIKRELRSTVRYILRYAVGLIVFAVLAHFGIIAGNKLDPVESVPETLQTTDGEYFVTRVVDGDTIVVNIDGTDTTVRYIGIDTPETKDPRKQVECFGVEASNKNTELVEGKLVTLSMDESETDRYGRLLRYVSVASGTQSIDVGFELVSNGYASALAIAPDTARYNVYKAAEQIARREKIGLWGDACSK